MRLFVGLVILVSLSACSPKGGGRSTMTLNIPSLTELNAKPSSHAQKVSTSSIDAGDIKWENACFMVSVTAPDLPGKVANICEVPSGVFYGSVAPDTAATPAKLSLEVPKGDGRRVVVYAYFRRSSAEACVVRDNMNGYSKDRVGTLGSLANVSIQKDTENLTVDIGLPTQMIAAELGLPLACTQQSATGGRFVSGTSGAKKTLINNYSVRTTVGFSSKSVSNTPNGFRVYRKRGTSQ